MADQCRPETVSVDGEEITVVVRGNRAMDAQDRAALTELVKATYTYFRAQETVRQRAIEVLVEHRMTEQHCQCGRYTRGRMHAVHVAQALINAGVLRPPTDQPGPEVTYGVAPAEIPAGAVLTAQALWDAMRDQFDPNDVWTYDEIGPLLRTFVSVLANRPPQASGGEP